MVLMIQIVLKTQKQVQIQMLQIVIATNQIPSSNVKYPATMYVNVDAAYIRSSASADSGKVTSVGKNCPVTVVSKDGDWYKVEVSDGKGYMKASLLSIDKQ